MENVKGFCKKVVGVIGKAFMHLAYPPICLHCREGMEQPDQLLCSSCLTMFSLINPRERCPVCFSADYEMDTGRCGGCLAGKSGLMMHCKAAAFDYAGPAQTLVKQLKYSNKPYLAQPLASYLVVQFCALEWPIPDIVVPVPMPWTHYIDRGYNQSALLAKEVARLLGTAYGDVLSRSAGDYSQAGLAIDQRKKLSSATWHLKNKEALYDKTVLLIDDVMTTGSTLMRCAEALSQGFPEKIYGLTLCCVTTG